MPSDLLGRLPPGETVAVATIYEESTGDITQLGNHLRDRVEASLAKRGLVVKARKDLVSILDDAEIDGDLNEAAIWREAGADILVKGSYVIEHGEGGSPPLVRLLFKAFSQDSVSLLDSRELSLRMNKSTIAAMNRILGNIHQQRFKAVVGDAGDIPPPLQAQLNKPGGCYKPGDLASISVDSEQGVYLYIFNLSCDGNVVALYPGPYDQNNGQNRPLTTDGLRFPSPGNSRIRALRLQQATPGQICRESFKLVAAREKLDFSYLPFPENTIFTGVNGRDIEKISQTLQRTTGSSTLLLDYRIDAGCP